MRSVPYLFAADHAMMITRWICGFMDEERVENMSKIDEELLGIMQCPVAHVPLVEKDDWLYSTDRNTRRKYPIRDGIPIMLIDESKIADEEEFDRVMAEKNSTSD